MSTNSTNSESGKFLRQQVAQARKGSKNDLDNKIKMLNQGGIFKKRCPMGDIGNYFTRSGEEEEVKVDSNYLQV